MEGGKGAIAQGKMLLTTRETARLVGVCENTVRNYVGAGTFPPPVLLPGNHKRFRRSDVEAWIGNLAAASNAA